MSEVEVFFCIGVINSNVESQFSICDDLDEAKNEIQKYGKSYEYCYIEKGLDGKESNRKVVYQSYRMNNDIFIR